MKKQIVVIGGGAAGMMAAIRAAENGAAVTLLEPNERLGKKLNITGKGRCNITNDADLETVLKNIPQNGRFLYSALSRFGTADAMAFFEGLGVPLKVERGKRVFPVSDRAFDVSAALERRLKSLRVRIVRDRAVSVETEPPHRPPSLKGGGREEMLSHSVPPFKGGYRGVPDGEGGYGEFPHVTGVTGGLAFYPAQAAILATGGVSYPAAGSTGEGHQIAKALGHSVTPLRGSLVPLCERGHICAQMQGLSLRNVALTVWETAADKKDGNEKDGNEKDGDKKGGSRKDRKIYSSFGELLFTHFGLSGPLILSASAHMRDFAHKRYRVELDLKPALDENALDKRLLADFQKYANHDFQNALDDLLPRKLIPVIVEESAIPPDRKVHDLTRIQRRRLLELLKRFPVAIAGTRPVTEAIVTSGGVDVREVHPATMESRFLRGLYFAGEILDVDAYTGGYNLQIAWSTGHAAGIAAAGES